MKTVNPARSAYACFTFKRMFFHVYQDGRDASSAETLKCKITVKVEFSDGIGLARLRCNL